MSRERPGDAAERRAVDGRMHCPDKRAGVLVVSATTRLPAAVVKTLPSPIAHAALEPAGPKLLGAGPWQPATHFHLTAPVAASSAMTPPVRRVEGTSRHRRRSAQAPGLAVESPCRLAPATGVRNRLRRRCVRHPRQAEVRLMFDLSICVSAEYPWAADVAGDLRPVVAGRCAAC